MSIDDEIASIKARINKAQIAKARSQAALEVAQENKDQAMRRLVDEFGVDNLDAVHVRLAELQSDLDTRMAQVSEILDTINI